MTTASPLRLSLRTRIALVATAVVTVLLWAGGRLIVRDSSAALERSLDTHVAAAAGDVAGQLREGRSTEEILLSPGNGPFPQPTVQIRTPDGALRASVAQGFSLSYGPDDGPPPLARPAVPVGPPSPPAPPEPPEPALHLLDAAAGWSVARVEVAGADRNLVVLAGAPYTVVGPALAPFEDRLRVAVPIAGLLTAVLASLLAQRALRPVERMREEAQAVTETSLSRRVPEPATNDEIGRLARTFNGMLARLEAAQSRQRQFVSDASHELRSPVAVLRSSLEVARAHPESTSWPDTVGDLLAVTDRLEHLVDDLLLLARLGEAGRPVPDDEVDLDEVVGEEVRLRAALPVSLTRLEAARVTGSRGDLGRVVANLLDNATRYARTTVEVSVRRNGSSVVLAVDDDGPGVPAAESDRVFERFVRLDAGRARTGGGAGLGLAVVRETVAAHGGATTVTGSPLGGARFLVTLPLAGPAGAGDGVPGD